MIKVGYSWLAEHFALKARPFAHSSFIGPKAIRYERANGTVEEHYARSSYTSREQPLENLAFALKYDGLDLDVLGKIFRHISPQEVADFVAKTPAGRFARKIGFWYEELTGLKVPLSIQITGNYDFLLDPETYVIAPRSVTNARWRIHNNTGGDHRFLPIIRRTSAIRHFEEIDWNGMISNVLRDFPQSVLYRALSYLYFKETKSSFAIEREDVGGSRMEKFVALLHRAGKEQNPLSENILTLLQNVIVEERYREKGFRVQQNFVGQTGPFCEIIHTIGAPPHLVHDLMEGISAYYHSSEGIPPTLRAAVISFAFVFIHPFEDGNGRLHRYLIHDILARGQIGGEGLMLPISAEILLNMRFYDACLEQFSKPLMVAADYSFDSEGGLTIRNPQEIEGFYRYPDLTVQCEFLAQMLEKTIRYTVPQEIHFLQKFDQARKAISEILDLPDRKRESLLMRLYGNNGKLSRKRREREFPELTDEEVAEIEKAYQKALSAKSS